MLYVFCENVTHDINYTIQEPSKFSIERNEVGVLSYFIGPQKLLIDE